MKKLPAGEISIYLSLERSGIHDVTYKIIRRYINKKLICNIFWGNCTFLFMNETNRCTVNFQFLLMAQ